MERFNGTIEGVYRVRADLDMSGMITGPVTVDPGVTLILHGMICADLFVEKGAKAEIYGTVDGCIWNRGGEVVVYGTVDNAVTDPGSVTIIDPEAVVKQR
jgi:hypothetical protein